jgi:hypothetical protein
LGYLYNSILLQRVSKEVQIPLVAIPFALKGHTPVSKGQRPWYKRVFAKSAPKGQKHYIVNQEKHIVRYNQFYIAEEIPDIRHGNSVFL